MTVAGMIFMAASWVAIIGLCAWCFSAIFRRHAERHLVAPLEIETEQKDEQS